MMHAATRTAVPALRPLLWTLLATLVLAACSATDPAPAIVEDAAVRSVQSDVIPGRFIVTVRDGVDPETVSSAFGLRPDFTYRTALNGFAGSIGEAARAGLMRDARVLRIEPDRTVHVFETQTGATWGLDRIDQRARPLDGTYTYETTASNVTVYVIDTGILLAHQEFAGRLIGGFDAVTSGGDANDCNGHGTHVAGTIGGTVYGVAKGVKLSPVRVLACNGSGTTSGVIAGLDWVTANHVKPAVANMSLGGGASSSLDEAVRGSIAAGITYSVAAGNGNRAGRQADACNYSPARVREALTVGATTSSDTKTSWSNYGTCVDLFAPGASITSAWHTSNSATNTISGTSMAAPHVAGVAALYLAADTTASPATVFSAIRSNVTSGVVTSSSTTKNDLVYSRFDMVTPPANQPPEASFTYSCTDLTCNFTDTSTDPDGSVTAWAWAFGDEESSAAQDPSHTYASAGTFTVTLTVTDDAGATDSSSKDLTVTAPSGAEPMLTVDLYKVQGLQKADLTWGGLGSTNVDVFRNGSKIATLANGSGEHTDPIDARGGGAYTYQVCEAGTSTCTSEVTASF